MRDDLVSVIMPVFNAERFISRSIESVLSQTYENLELIVVDDCSTDRSLEIVRSFKDDRLKIIALAMNSGVADARNIGINAALGRFLAFCDSDDFWFTEKLLVQLRLMEKKNAPIVHSDCRLIDQDGVVVGIRRYPKVVTYQMERYRNFICNSSALVDRAKCPRVEQTNVYHEDYVMWLNLMREVRQSISSGVVLLDYTLNPKGLSSNKFRSIKGSLTVQKLHGVRTLERLKGLVLNLQSRYRGRS